MYSKYQIIKILRNCFQNMNWFSQIKLIPVLIHLKIFILPFPIPRGSLPLSPSLSSLKKTHVNKMFDSCPSKLDNEMIPLRFGFWPKQQQVLQNLCILNIFFSQLPGGKSTDPGEFNCFYISLVKSLNIILIPGAKLNCHLAIWTGSCKLSFFYIF